MNYKAQNIWISRIRTVIFFGFAPLLLLFFTTCGKEYIFATEADCNDCYQSIPYDGPIHIKLSGGASLDSIEVKVFKGKFIEKMLRDNSYIYSYLTIESELDVYVPLDEYYSVVATYKVGDKTYNVVDGDRIKLYSIEKTCETECWIIRGGDMNCQLKF